MAAQTVTIAGFPKEGRLEMDVTGHYADLTRLLLEDSPVDTAFLVYPIKRLGRLFEVPGDRCYIPLNFNAMQLVYSSVKREEFIDSEPIDYVSAHIFTAQGSEPIRELVDLNGKRVGAWVGAPFGPFFDGLDIRLYKAESEESTVRLLAQGRVDAIWNWSPDVFVLSERLGLPVPVTDLSKPLFEVKIHYLCYKTPATERLVPHLNRGIKALRRSGRLAEIMGKYARIVED